VIRVPALVEYRQAGFRVYGTPVFPGIQRACAGSRSNDPSIADTVRMQSLPGPPSRWLRRLATSCALLLLAHAALTAQTTTATTPDAFSTGRLFVLAFPDTVGNERDDVFPDTRFNEAAIVMIYSAVPNRVTITGGNGLVRWSRSLDSGRITTIDLMRPEFNDPFGPISPTPSVQRKNAFRLETEQPVVVYCYLQTIWGGEAWTPLPVEAWGREYYAAAFPGDVVSSIYYVNKALRTRAQAAPSEIVIVAAYDDTQIAVFANGRIINQPSLITLNANEAFQLRSFVDTMPRTDLLQADLGGSYIVSSRPIGVLSGNTRTAIIDERSGLTKNALKGMAIEWLAPADEHGRAMAFTPVFDDLRVAGTKNEPLSTKRPGEIIRVYGTMKDSTRGELSARTEAPRSIFVSRSSVQQIRLDGLQTARSLVTTAPVQAMSSPSGVIRSALGGGYDTWAGFTTELVPREQWTSFAPFMAPSVPVGMRHYINIVTDTVAMNDIYLDGQRMRLTMGGIPNSDLVWGTAEVSVGFQHRLEGHNGARFSATMYGLLPGSEKTINGLYREYLALSYGHALAPARRALSLRDSLLLDSSRDCSTMSVRVTTAGGTVETIRSIRLDSATNVRLTPGDLEKGPAITPLSLRLETIDARRDARATLLVEDRAGRIHRVEYARAAEVVSLEPAGGLAFGEAMVGDTIVRQFEIRNRSLAPIHLRSIRFASAGAGFVLADSFTARTLAPSESLALFIVAQPTGRVGTRLDTAIFALECSEVRLPVSIAVVEPCLEIGDLDFGAVDHGAFVTRTLRVCNSGRGRLGLLAVAGDSAITWGDRAFSVNQVYLDILRRTSLEAGECVSVEVYFRAERPGRFETVARVAPSGGVCRDSSTWIAVVLPAAGVIDEMGIGESEISVEGRHVIVALDGPRGASVRLEVFDAAGRAVVAPIERRLEPGGQRLEWDASSVPAGVYYCSLSIDGRTLVRPVVLR
jgi:hypothetical protein